MTILDELMKEHQSSEVDEAVKIICDKIMEEEKPKCTNPDLEPIGPNIFLAVQFKNGKNISFLCLEREMKEKYFLSVWVRSINFPTMKREYVEQINESNPKKIIKAFAEKLSFLKGD